MNRGFFITGTDTGIGKTFVTALIAASLRERDIDVGVMKPVETGCVTEGGRLVPGDALLLKEAAKARDELDLINPYRFRLPASPSIAARKEGIVIECGSIRDSFDLLTERHDILLVEGVGGLMVPLNGKETVADLIRLLAIPTIIVSGTQLGTINHTLLTVSTARQHGIEVAGIIFNRYSEDEENAVGEIARFTGLPLLGRVPTRNNETPLEYLSTALDISLFLKR